MTLVDEVKARLTIVDVVSDYVALENLSSRTPKALCPFHDERTPSFSISLEHDSWRCWGACGVGGGMFDFVMRADGIEFKEALEKLALKAGIEPNFKDEYSDNRRRSRSAALHEVNQIAEDFFTRQLEGAQGREALAYLESRGIDAQTARRRGIGYAPGGVNSLIAYLKSIAADSQAVVQSGLVVKGNDDAWRDMFTNRITIAIRDPRGKVIGFGARAMGDAQPKYLNTHETSIFNKSKILYGMHWASDAIRASGRAIVVEGYMDVIAAQERGFKNVVACMGTAVTSQQLQTISTVLPDDPDNPPSIVLCLDADEAGQQATLRGLQVALSEFGRRTATQTNNRRAPIDIRIASPVVSEHGEAKDPDEAIRNNGPEWIASIDQADEIIDFVIRTSLSSHNTATENGLDAALNEVEPYFENIPPHTIREQRKLNSLGEQLGIAIDDMIHVLTRKRSARETVQNASNPDNNSRRSPTRRTGTTPPAIPVAIAAIQARWESDLLACMLQYDYAIDHAANVEPYHFTDPVRRRVFQELRIAGNLEGCVGRIESDIEALSLVKRLKEVPLSPTDETIEDQAAIIQIAETCAKRTRREYLTRTKKREVQLAKENGNMFREEDMITAVKTNREIRELANPQHAAPTH
ncbi:MAG: DNA primase [Chloroflexi bacterium]|nr:DNA primase [Chloroflexota bacterium]